MEKEPVQGPRDVTLSVAVFATLLILLTFLVRLLTLKDRQIIIVKRREKTDTNTSTRDFELGAH